MSLNGLNHKEIDKLMDSVGWRILEELQNDARINYVELGRRVGLTSPAVAERVRRMEDAGIITGYRVMVNPAKVGLSVMAIIRLRTNDCRRTMDHLTNHIDQFPEMLDCYRITGEDSLIMRVAVSDMAHLENLVDRMLAYGETTTSIVLSSIESRTLTKEMIAPETETEY